MERKIVIEENRSPISVGRFHKILYGTYGEIQVAVKRVELHNVLKEDEYQRFHYLDSPQISQKPYREVYVVREEHALTKLDHPNIVKLLHVNDEYPFRYIVLELCTTSLYQYCHLYNWDQPRPPMPSDATVLLDIVRGLRYVHFKGLAHRNIHPKNILISSTLPVVVKLADFGLCKSVNDRGSHSVSRDQGSVCYKAPELLDDNNPEKRGSIASDTFSAGLVFFFYLSKGFHLFGRNPILIKMNILMLNQPCQDNDGHQLEANGVNWHELPDDQKHFETLIKSMIKASPGDRARLFSVESILSEIVGVQDETRPQHIQDEDEIDSFDYLM